MCVTGYIITNTKTRIQKDVSINDYSSQELLDILNFYLSNKDYEIITISNLDNIKPFSVKL